jgi:hypothetical protein
MPTITTIVAFKAKPHVAAFGPLILTERRSRSRYPLALGVRFHFRIKDLLISGQGRTVNFSAGGLLIASQHSTSHDEVPTGTRVQMIIDWPVLLDGKIALQLHAAGRVVRKGSDDFAATFLRHEFRTMRRATLRPIHSGAEVVPWPIGNFPSLD